LNRWRLRRARALLLWWKVEHAIAAAAFPFRRPVLWWFAVRLRLHYSWGLPMPRIPKARIWV
jgi:hypothetical protein